MREGRGAPRRRGVGKWAGRHSEIRKRMWPDWRDTQSPGVWKVKVKVVLIVLWDYVTRLSKMSPVQLEREE